MRRDLEAKEPLSCWNKAKPDEIVFVLLARDLATPVAMEAWCRERIRLGKNKETDLQIVEAREDAAKIRSHLGERP